MSQNLRVALWVPQADPISVGNAIRTISPPSANKVVPSEFGSSGGGAGGADFATQGEVTLGTIANEVISPLTLRNDHARMLDIPAPAFTGVVAIQISVGLPASANKLIKTNDGGVLDETMLPLLDGGLF